MSEIRSTEIALLVCGKNINATVLDYIINRMDSKDSLLHSESKGQVNRPYATQILVSETPQQCCLAVRLSSCVGFSYNSSGSC